MEKVIDKIRKLLALAKDAGATEAEAAAAMAKASDLMLQHNLDLGVVDAQEERVKVTRGNRTDPLDKWERIVAQAVAHLYDCRTIVWGRSGTLCFVGRPFNVRACEETLPFVLEQVEAQYKIGLKAFKLDQGSLDKAKRGEFRITFKESCALKLWRIANEIKAAQKNMIPDHRALIVIDTMSQEIDAHMAQTGVSKGRSMVVRSSGLGTGAGITAASNIKLQGRVNK